jgi:hypothetical protein
MMLCFVLWISLLLVARGQQGQNCSSVDAVAFQPVTLEAGNLNLRFLP